MFLEISFYNSNLVEGVNKQKCMRRWDWRSRLPEQLLYYFLTIIYKGNDKKKLPDLKDGVPSKLVCWKS